MKFLIPFFLVMNLSMLSGCEIMQQIGVISMPPVSSLENNALCTAYHNSLPGLSFNTETMAKRRIVLYNEINSRGLMTSNDWIDINAQRINVGDSRCAVLVVFGLPDDDRTIDANGIEDQLVYGDPTNPYETAQYIYITNGIVSALHP